MTEPAASPAAPPAPLDHDGHFTVGFLGPAGTFTEQALSTQPDLLAGELVGIGTIADVLAATEAGEVDLGFVAIENAIEGTVNVTQDTLALDADLLIQREVVIPVHLNLLGRPGATLDGITTVVSIPIATALAIVLAVLLNQPIRGRAFFRACIFIPTIVPLAAAGLIWMWMFNPDYGPLSAVIRLIGLTPPLWLESPRWAMASLVIVSLWFIGSPVVIYLAALGDIPRSLYEAARIDGAGPSRQFWHISLPGLSPVILFNVIVGIINAWQVFALPYLMWRTRPGPDRATYFYTMYLFDNAFSYLKMGYASAMAWIQLLIVLALTGLVFWASRRMVHYRA